LYDTRVERKSLLFATIRGRLPPARTKFSKFISERRWRMKYVPNDSVA
jgi:hypothetical protein